MYKFRSRRTLIALVVAATVFSLVGAFATSLTTSTTNLQGGKSTVSTVCTGTVATSYTSTGVDGSGNPIVSSATVDITSGSCTDGTGYTVTVMLLQSGTAILGTAVSGTGVTIATDAFTAEGGANTSLSSGKLVFDFSGQSLKVSDLTGIAVVVQS